MNLERLGWNQRLQQVFDSQSDQHLTPGRVIRAYRDRWIVMTEDSERDASLSGKYRHDQDRPDYTIPTVGDWVLIDPVDETTATIKTVLPRTGAIDRKAASSGGMPESGGQTRAQTLAANIDYALLIAALDHEFNLRRIERYLVTAYDSGATPVIILNKADLCAEVEERAAEVEAVAIGVDIHIMSALNGDGIQPIADYLTPNRTGVLLGSSGVGKSTLTNSLLGEQRMITQEIREDDSHGRHTTTHRELVLLPSGGILIDTPGLRQLQLWVEEESIRAVFDDIEQLGAGCRFRDCQHENEPDCAVKLAIDSGRLDAGRLASYHKLRREMRRLEARQAGLDRHYQHLKGRKFASVIKEVKRLKGRYQ